MSGRFHIQLYYTMNPTISNGDSEKKQSLNFVYLRPKALYSITARSTVFGPVSIKIERGKHKWSN
jgi:hypothetical protein